jgi:hypothetical protein
MIKPSRALKASRVRGGLALSCAFSALAACSQGSSTANTTGMDNSLADAPPPTTALPLASGPAPTSRAAPVASALPSAPSAPLGQVTPADQYAYLNQAYDFSQSLADAPPDYTYDYQGEQPWVWQSPEGDYRVAERLPVGWRYFYYAPGASTPYLVQDPQYSYAYSRGALAVVYGPNGEVLPYDVEARQARAAGLYLAWAAGLYAAAQHEQHVAVAQSRWAAERQAVNADQARWNAAQARNTGWAAYSQTHPEDQAHWADQRYGRAAEAARFAQAVHDQSALARAQQAATDARTTVQSRGERVPGPAPQGVFSRRENRDGAAPAVGMTGTPRDQAPQPHDPPAERAHGEAQAPVQSRAHALASSEAQPQAARPVVAQERAHSDAASGAGRQAPAHDDSARRPPAMHPPTAAAPQVALDRSRTESPRPPTEQTAAPPRVTTPAPVVAARPTAQIAHPADGHPEPAKPKPKRDEPPR